MAEHRLQEALGSLKKYKSSYDATTPCDLGISV